MFNAIIALGVTITVFAITFVFGGFGMAHVWQATSQIVQGSGNVQLQATYGATAPIVTTASDAYDWWGFARSLSIIIGLGGTMFLGIKYLPALIDEVF